jgi:hypothetical protein
MGHSDPRLTLVQYGQWSETTKQAEVQRIDAVGFPIWGWPCRRGACLETNSSSRRS